MTRLQDASSTSPIAEGNPLAYLDADALPPIVNVFGNGHLMRFFVTGACGFGASRGGGTTGTSSPLTCGFTSTGWTSPTPSAVRRRRT